MPLPTSLQAYSDCFDFFERIADDKVGGRVCLGSHEDAKYFRMRCNNFRSLTREQSRKIYDEGDAKYGTTVYDPFRLQLKEDTDGKWWVYAVRMSLDANQVELLSELEDGDEA